MSGDERLIRLDHALRGPNPPGVVFPVSLAILIASTTPPCSANLLATASADRKTEADGEWQRESAEGYPRFLSVFRQPRTRIFSTTGLLRTIEEDLPNDTDYRGRCDIFRAGVEAMIDMSDQTTDLLCRTLRQNSGRFSKHTQQNEFAQLNCNKASSCRANSASL